MPQYVAGLTVEPIVCEPSASGTMHAATAAAEPLDEPPGVRDSSCGLVVGPADAMAYSVDTVVPRMTAPADRKRATTAASLAGILARCSDVPQPQRMP